MPAGTYLISSHLGVSYNTALVGDWEAPPAPTKLNPETAEVDVNVNASEALLAGTVLLAVEGAGDRAQHAFIEMQRNATLKGL